jgi:hypothetical protein
VSVSPHQRAASPGWYTALLDAVHGIEAFAGFCYTQLTDVYQEVNGLLTADRTPKVPLEVIRKATLGRPSPFSGYRPRPTR